jgi:hypothetical protein
VLIFDKPKDGWKNGNAAVEKEKEKEKANTGALDLSDLLGALRTQMASVEKGMKRTNWISFKKIFFLLQLRLYETERSRSVWWL